MSGKPYKRLHALTMNHRVKKMHHDLNNRYTSERHNTLAIKHCVKKNLKQQTPNKTDKQKNFS